MTATGDGPRTQGYAKGRLTKQAIVERAAEAFAQKGFYGASLRSIAREAGVDHSTLLHHFGNKTALLLAVIEWRDTLAMPGERPGVDQVVALIRDTPVEQIAQRFAENARRNAQSPGLVQLLSILTAEAGSHDHPAREVLRTRHDALRDILAAVITRGREENGTADPLTPEERAAVIIATQEGLETYSALHPGEIDMPKLYGAVLAEAFEIAPRERT